jgi:hypothetical protein
MHKNLTSKHIHSIKYSLLLFLFFDLQQQIYTMEQNEIQKTCTYNIFLPDEMLIKEILPHIIQPLNKYQNPEFILSQTEDVFVKRDPSTNFGWSKYGYFSNNTIFLRNPEIVVAENLEEHFHLINIFKSVDILAKHIQFAQKVACVNKATAQNLYVPILTAKLTLAKFILLKTDYQWTILNMLDNHESNHFFLEQTHYVIAHALGNAFSCGNQLKLKESHYKQIQFCITEVLRASCHTHANRLHCTQKRHYSMSDDLATNERLNRFIVHLFLGMIQPWKDKRYRLEYEIFRAVPGETITNTNYIKDTAEKMGLDLNISFESFFSKPYDNLIIEIGEYKTTIEKIKQFFNE